MSIAQAPAAALVAIPGPAPAAANRYLCVKGAGQADWVDDPEAATAFASMREAARTARLPASLRAFGLPRAPELALGRLQFPKADCRWVRF